MPSLNTESSTLHSLEAAKDNCDTLPEPQNLAIAGNVMNDATHRQPSPRPNHTDGESMVFDVPTVQELQGPIAIPAERSTTPPPQPPARKLCFRHQQMADEGINSKLQQALDDLPEIEREKVSAIWSGFSSSSHPRRALILQGLLTMCCFSQLSLLTEQLGQLIRIDPLRLLPLEVSLRILGYLDAISLCRAAQVSKRWKKLADDDILWRGICEQHIGHKCNKCGWGLPLLEKKSTRHSRTIFPTPFNSTNGSSLSSKRELEELQGDDLRLHSVPHHPRPLKRQKSETAAMAQLQLSSRDSSPGPLHESPLISAPSSCPSTTRPWKDVYCERLSVERNWRRGRHTVRSLKGHSDGVMCLQFSETLCHPSFPVLITGSYDTTARVWNLDTGVEVRCLRGHARAIRALQFDEVKLITGSLDGTLRMWNWRTGQCIRVLEGHTDGVVSLNFDANILASGSVDTTIKIWNFRTGECYTLRGHRDWVNAVQLWDGKIGSESMCFNSLAASMSTANGLPDIDPGKMLFSASDDGTIRLWDLNSRVCVRKFLGHVGQVQTMKLLILDSVDDSGRAESSPVDTRSPLSRSQPSSPITLPSGLPGFSSAADTFGSPGSSSFLQRSPSKPSSGPIPLLYSGSLDNTIRLWDITTGKPIKTLFGHIEGVWSIASTTLRLVSGSHDRTIKVWDREQGKCMATLIGHRAAVSCLAMGDDKVISGSEDGDIRVWSFAPS